jgi:hypothetical protein
MAAATESIALKILAALKAEYEREPSLLKCRPHEEILSAVAKPIVSTRRMFRLPTDF